jgi:hypothetical protein
MKITIPIVKTNSYDNLGAYIELQKIMKSGVKMDVMFNGNRDLVPCAIIETKQIAWFKYQLKESSLQGLIEYLMNGKIADFDANPQEVDHLKNGEDFPLNLMKSFIEANQTLQFVPLFRENTPNTISAYLHTMRGTIYFKIKRTEDLLDYLREHKQIN